MREADVCLVTEGTYPYVKGGVGEWVQDLMEGMPDVSFSLAHLRYPDAPAKRAYEAPANLGAVAEIELDSDEERLPGDFADRIPAARTYHALTTSMAGEAAGAVARERGAPFVLTEHGIVWREAPMGSPGCHKHRTPSHLTFRRLARQAREAYARADVVSTVCDHNSRLQRAAGVPAARSRVIENWTGCGTAATRPASESPLIGFVGRVVRIKDVATFLRACALVREQLPAAEFVVVGPLDHDSEHVEECRELERELGLDVRFTGEADPREWYPRLDALALTSLSEAQPLVALEAMAAGVPVVATRVGGCPELLSGGAGLLTGTRDPAGTARALVRACTDTGLRERVTRRAAARVRARHDRGRGIGAYRRLYEELA